MVKRMSFDACCKSDDCTRDSLFVSLTLGKPTLIGVPDGGRVQTSRSNRLSIVFLPFTY